MEAYRDLGTYDGLSGFEGAQGKLVRVRYQLRDLQERFQTFAGSHPYRLAEGASPGINGTGEFGTITEIIGNFGPLEPGQTMIRIVLEDPPPEPDINLYGEFSLGVAFTDPAGEDVVLHGSPVLENLLNIRSYVGDLVTQIELTCKRLRLGLSRPP
jgi:hypothetical protein